MVCDRCKTAVVKVLRDQNISFQHIELGEVEIAEVLNKEKTTLLKTALHQLGFELIDDKKSRIIEQIKTEVITSIQQAKSKKEFFDSFIRKNRERLFFYQFFVFGG